MPSPQTTTLIRGRDEGENIAKNIVRSRAEPRTTVKFAAKSLRAHNLRAGEMPPRRPQ